MSASRLRPNCLSGGNGNETTGRFPRRSSRTNRRRSTVNVRNCENVSSTTICGFLLFFTFLEFSFKLNRHRGENADRTNGNRVFTRAEDCHFESVKKTDLLCFGLTPEPKPDDLNTSDCVTRAPNLTEIQSAAVSSNPYTYNKRVCGLFLFPSLFI